MKEIKSREIFSTRGIEKKEPVISTPRKFKEVECNVEKIEKQGNKKTRFLK